jgi:hypothetical protein
MYGYVEYPVAVLLIVKARSLFVYSFKLNCFVFLSLYGMRPSHAP